MSDTEYLNEFYKFVSTNSILVVTKKGELIRLYCPFEVVAKVNFEEIAAGEIVWVEKVQITPESKDVYIIDNKAYLTMYFQIVVDSLPPIRLTFIYGNKDSRDEAKPISRLPQSSGKLLITDIRNPAICQKIK